MKAVELEERRWPRPAPGSAVVEGDFALEPGERSEVGMRDNAACMFVSRGKLRGEFVLDPAIGTLAELRFVAHDAEFAWRPRTGARPDEFAPRHRVAVEWVRAALQ